MTTTLSSVISWSKLDSMPVVHHNDELDVDVVAWNGILMSKEHALMVASAILLQIYPTPEMKRMADKKWAELLKRGAFGDVDWNEDHWTTGYHSTRLHNYYLKSVMPVTEKLESMPKNKIFSIFGIIMDQNS